MRFADALEQGLTEFGKPDKTITTFVSRLFVFGDKVLKVYKYEPFFFADLAAFESRKEFFTEDFFYNNTAAPEIYLHLWGVEEKDGTFALVPPSQGSDFVIEMSLIDDSQTLTKLLNNRQLQAAHIEPFCDALVDTLATLTRERRSRLSELFSKGLYQISRENAISMRSWMYGAQPHISKEETDETIDLMLKAIESEPYFKNTPSESLIAAIDDNSDNLLLLNGKPSFIDIMPPMVVWRAVDEYTVIARYIVDLEVLGSKEFGEAARKAYSKYGRDIPPIARLAHEIRASAIQWSYRYALGQPEVAAKFGMYTKTKMEELRALLK